jgi:hypothetical protein
MVHPSLGTYSISEEIIVNSFKKARVSNTLEGRENDYIWEETTNKTSHHSQFPKKMTSEEVFWFL